MKIVKLILAGIAGLAISSATLADTLTLSTQNEPNPVSVNCNGKNGPQVIPPNGSINPIEFFMINLWFGSSTLQCKFTESNTGLQIGTANLLLSSNMQQAEIQSITSPYQINITPSNALGNYVNNIAVTLIK